MGLRGLIAADGVVMKPSIWGKLKTNTQFLAILLAILHPSIDIGPLRLDEVAMLAAALITVASAVEYLVRFSGSLTGAASGTET
jgi:CDP-diacylglycerol--glycerol-3-phosphate 3-phosphatidyltransferase